MIGIFDSGIGGVTVFKEILKVLPNYKYIYYSDSINNPYGNKNKDELLKITSDIVSYLLNEGCDIIVIACNTASAVCKDYLRVKFNIPIIAIEPALKLVYDNNYQDKTLVLATKGTLESIKFKELYYKYNNHNTMLYECIGLADLIERNDSIKIKDYLNKNIKKFKEVKNVVLGCTHYPLIKEEIKSVLGNVNFYDGSKGVAVKLVETALEYNIKSNKQYIKFIDSSGSLVKEKRFYDLLN